MTITGRSDRTKFRHQVLNLLLEAGLIEMTITDKPRSSKQKYRLTEKGGQVLTGIKGDAPSDQVTAQVGYVRGPTWSVSE